MEWLEKDRHLALRTPEGRIVAIVGASVVAVEVEEDAFDVVGLGGLFITRSQRGRGLMSLLIEPLLSLARELGPERAMLFCSAELLAVYARAGFHEVAAPVWVDRPGGRVRMEMRAMWRALGESADWPDGRVDVLALPF
jgi:predicted GNAT family N-acyltransferase